MKSRFDKFSINKLSPDNLSPDNLRYSSVRGDFKDGDIVMYKGRSLISKLIRIFTKSDYSHAGIVCWWNNRLMVMEAVGRGVIVTPLSSNIKEYTGDVEWFAHKGIITDENRIKMVEYAQLELGKEYDNKQLIKIALRMLLRKPVSAYDKLKRKKRLFCSFYVSSVYNYIKIDLKEKTADDFTTPDDIAKSPVLEKKGVLKIFKE